MTTERAGYLITAEDGTRVAVYCSGCTSFFVKGFSGEEELQAFKDGRPFRRVSNCPYSLDCPSYCRDHEVTYVGDAPPQMVEWLESGRSDWPKCPAAARISACTELLNRGHGRPVDQRAMLMIGAQLNSDRPVREMSTAELIERINELRP